MNSNMDFSGFVQLLLTIINTAIPALFAVTLAVVFWQVVKTWVISGGDPNSIKTGKSTIVVAIIALTVMASVWGLVNVLKTSLF